MDLSQATVNLREALTKAREKTNVFVDTRRQIQSDVDSVIESVRVGRMRITDLKSVLSDSLMHDEKKRREMTIVVDTLQASLEDVQNFLQSNRSVYENAQSRNLTSVLDAANKMMNGK